MVLESDHLSLSEDDADDDVSTSLSLSSESLDTGLVRQSRPRPSKPFKHRLRKNKNSALANSINNIDDDGSHKWLMVMTMMMESEVLHCILQVLSQFMQLNDDWIGISWGIFLLQLNDVWTGKMIKCIVD